MALVNFFKKKKKEKPEEEKVKLPEKPKSEPQVAQKEKRTTNIYRILKSVHITEKATDLTKENQYVFQVWPAANKVEVKKAIKELYGVDVLSVKIINVPPKRRRLGRISGWRKGYKKAIVKIKEGQKIEVLPR